MPSVPAKLTAAISAVIFFLIILFLAVKSASAQVNFIAEINQFRASKGLAPVRTNASTCGFAATRASEISASFSHNGFYSRVQGRTLPYPRYRLVTENLAFAPNGMNPVQMWINSPSHATNMLKNTPFVCVVQHGDYYAYEGLTI